jgi:hypothetical protein
MNYLIYILFGFLLTVVTSIIYLTITEIVYFSDILSRGYPFKHARDWKRYAIISIALLIAFFGFNFYAFGQSIGLLSI